MTRARVAAVALAAAGLAACTHPRVDDPTRVDADDAIVHLRVAVPDAALWIDGIFVGPVADLARGFALEPGRHRLELHHDGYFSHYQVLELTPAQRLDLAIDLAPQLP